MNEIDNDIVTAVLLYCPEIPFDSIQKFSRFGVEHVCTALWKFTKGIETDYNRLIKSLPYIELAETISFDGRVYEYYRIKKETAKEIKTYIKILKNI